MRRVGYLATGNCGRHAGYSRHCRSVLIENSITHGRYHFFSIVISLLLLARYMISYDDLAIL
jgi:hypothetical protein